MAVSVKDILNVPTIDQLNQQYWQSQPNSIRQVRARGFGLFYQLIQGMLLMLLSLWKMLYAASYNLSDLNNARIVGAGPLIVIDTDVAGSHRSKPSYKTFMSSNVATDTPELPTLP